MENIRILELRSYIFMADYREAHMMNNKEISTNNIFINLIDLSSQILSFWLLGLLHQQLHSPSLTLTLTWLFNSIIISQLLNTTFRCLHNYFEQTHTSHIIFSCPIPPPLTQTVSSSYLFMVLPTAENHAQRLTSLSRRFKSPAKMTG